jgi:hypothetical protein
VRKCIDIIVVLLARRGADCTVDERLSSREETRSALLDRHYFRVEAGGDLVDMVVGGNFNVTLELVLLFDLDEECLGSSLSAWRSLGQDW